MVLVCSDSPLNTVVARIQTNCQTPAVNRAEISGGCSVWVLRRHGAGLDFGVAAFLNLCWRNVRDGLEETARVVPVDPFEHGELDSPEAAPWPRWPRRCNETQSRFGAGAPELPVHLVARAWRGPLVADRGSGNLARVPAHTESPTTQRGPRHQPSGNPSVARRCTPPCPASTPGSAAPAQTKPRRGPPPHRAASLAGSFAGSGHEADAKDSGLSPPIRYGQNERELALDSGQTRRGSLPVPSAVATRPPSSTP